MTREDSSEILFLGNSHAGCGEDGQGQLRLAILMLEFRAEMGPWPMPKDGGGAGDWSMAAD